ncbi:MAG: polysaccharide deacetylase family protein [Armatimonadetes bacterium]|nr:polysaccharide deacetylase family protein [Armatimonadota bacterium]
MRIATWKHGKAWVYSITYDEALADLARFVIPIHQELGIPGHVEVVAGHIGAVRQLGESSFNGMRHMNAAELRGLIAMGWGVGCHSWSHGTVMDDPDRELRQARETVQDAIGRPVTVYTSPGTNENLTADVQEKLREYRYLAGLSITDDINYPDVADLLWVNRVPIHERYWGVFDSAFDAHKRIRQAQDAHGWIVDYCHCPLEKAVHDYKDCTAAHHRERLETVVSEGGERCWYADPDEVVDYRYMRRHARLEGNVLRLEGLPDQVQCRELTFEADDGRLVTLTVHDSMEISI